MLKQRYHLAILVGPITLEGMDLAEIAGRLNEAVWCLHPMGANSVIEDVQRCSLFESIPINCVCKFNPGSYGMHVW